MTTKTCPTCQAKWIDDQLYWSTGKPGSELDLAGLVCNASANGRRCINPCRGLDGGDTWQKRSQHLDKALAEIDVAFSASVMD